MSNEYFHNDKSILRDCTTTQNNTGLGSSRRMSLGSYTSPAGGGEVDKDRRQLLEEWRRQKRAATPQENKPPCDYSSVSKSQDEQSIKRPRIEYMSTPSKSQGTPPLPHVPLHPDSLHSNATTDTSSIVERMRMRRQQRPPMSQEENTNTLLPPHPPSEPTKKTSICFDDDESPTISGGSALKSSMSTPSSNRRYSMASGARRISRGRMSLGTPIQHHDSKDTETTNQTFTSSFEESEHETENLDPSMDGPGVQSKLSLMRKRIAELEEEKMALSMMKAPLEARLRQKEDQWVKEKLKYEQNIQSEKVKYNELDEKYKSLEMQYESVQEERTQLRYEVASRAASAVDVGEDDGKSELWKRQLQNDRDVAALKDKLKYAEDEIKDLRLAKVSVESELQIESNEHSSLMKKYDCLLVDYKEIMSKKDSNVEAEIQLQELSKEHVATTAQLNAINGEFESLKMQSKFESDIRERKWNDEKDKMMFEISVLKSRVATSSQEKRSDAVTDEDDTAILKARIEEKNRRIAELEAEILKGEQIRRNMHNRIQELRGNIRVYVRTRPFLPADGDSKSSCIDILGDGESLAITDPRNKEPSAFKFDKVFPPSAGQDCVFQEVSDFVQSALDGYNVCLFSYGQTGSGKTHTMQGSGTGVMRGIIPRAVEQILGQIKNLQNCRWKYQMTASFLEIYNEELRDLLHCLNVSSVRGTGKSDDLKANKLTIRRHQEGRSYVEGLSEVEIDCSDFTLGMEKLKSVIVSASRARSVATTKMNEVSSRSHSVFILNISGLNEDDGTIVKGTLNLCDLAGSERLDRSGAISDTQRLKETQSINKSLSCLGDVFNALGQGAAHVPFRNSKLTYLLQDCLSGDGKALMFVNLSPTFESVGESLCSLRFAQRVNQVELGKATKNVQYHNKGSQKK